MRLILGIVFLVVGVLVFLAGVLDRTGQFGFGSRAGLERSRARDRAKALIAGPLIAAVGVVVLIDPLAG